MFNASCCVPSSIYASQYDLEDTSTFQIQYYFGYALSYNNNWCSTYVAADGVSLSSTATIQPYQGANGSAIWYDTTYNYMFTVTPGMDVSVTLIQDPYFNVTNSNMYPRCGFTT